MFHDLFSSAHTWTFLGGFALGMLLLFFSIKSHLRTSGELKRMRNLLSDKLDLEHRTFKNLTADRDHLAKENENLRVKVQQLNERADNKLSRDLEIYARAEKQMKINAPGFAGAWELAKETAHNQVAEEEKGASLPQRIFRKLLGGGSAPAQNLPAETAKPAAPSETAV